MANDLELSPTELEEDFCPDCGEEFDEQDRCSGCDFGHDDCDIRDCFECYERLICKAENAADAAREGGY
jgi:hypothetical protein